LNKRNTNTLHAHFSREKKNKQKMSRGKVYIGQKQQRGVAGDRAAKRDGVLSIDVTSASMTLLGADKVRASTLSPFRVGPVVDKSDTQLSARIFENRWQYGKMWPTANHINADGSPSPEWFKFRAKGYASNIPKRRPLPKKQYGFATSSFYNGRVHGYVESRKLIYVPEYMELIRHSSAIREMRDHLDEGTSILVLDNDAPPKTMWREGREMTQELWDEMIDNKDLPFGHGYVVAALLAGNIDIEGAKNKRQKRDE
jgi:hypothetical protein